MRKISNTFFLLTFELLKKTKIMAINLRSPGYGVLGYIAKQIMLIGNKKLSEDCVRRLNVQTTDTVVEIGSGNGHAIASILKKNPKSVEAIEISPVFQSILQERFKNKIHIINQDAKCLGRYFKDNAVDKLLLINVIYFLVPLDEYLIEFNRILKHGGMIIMAGNFEIAKTLHESIFINKDLSTLLSVLAKYFSVNHEQVELKQGRYQYSIIYLKKKQP